MFDAAKAALLGSIASGLVEIGRTHGSLISAFGLYLVKPGVVPIELGRALNRAE